MNNIKPCLWFKSNAEEAIEYYKSIFPNSSISNKTYMNGPDGEKSFLYAEIQLDGQEFAVLNGNNQFSFNPSISIFVTCKNQEEVDYYWDKLSEGGREDRCGWLQDKYGISWQIVPDIMGKMFQDKDTEKAGRAMNKMLTMKKLIIAELEQAYHGTIS